VALDRAMIPLGSCTMKLNATTEMIPITWPEFGHAASLRAAGPGAGLRQLFEELEAMAGEITGYDAVSLQPNAGARASMPACWPSAAITGARGEAHRNVCLIPSRRTAPTRPRRHGGMKVVVVPATTHGNVDVATSAPRRSSTKPNLAALMITYPSTHGVFEEAVSEICAIVHAHGGQVYLDGANLNAQVGLCGPAELGADVCHLNLHKTFCIPHGGGGPGMGPIGVKAHLAPILPGHPGGDRRQSGSGRDRSQGPSRPRPWGSASILPISWTYIAMMGGEGLTKAPRGGHPQRQLHRQRAWIRTSRCSTRAPAALWRMSASSTCAWLKERSGSPWTTSPSAWSTTASTRPPCPSRCPAR
jgi:glycine dehydrogenase